MGSQNQLTVGQIEIVSIEHVFDTVTRHGGPWQHQRTQQRQQIKH